MLFCPSVYYNKLSVLWLICQNNIFQTNIFTRLVAVISQQTHNSIVNGFVDSSKDVHIMLA